MTITRILGVARRASAREAARQEAEYACQELQRDVVALRTALNRADDRNVALRSLSIQLETDLEFWKSQALARGMEVVELRMQLGARFDAAEPRLRLVAGGDR